jgi:hypothetical protein
MGLIDKKKNNSPAQCRIALAQNCIALSKLIKVSSHAAFFKETIYQKIVHR